MVVMVLVTLTININMWLQTEAALLRNVTSGDSATKLVVLGVGSVDEAELQAIASEPHDMNLIHVRDITSLTRLQEVLWEKSCGSKHVSFCRRAKS